jgi:hypothetical protein
MLPIVRNLDQMRQRELAQAMTATYGEALQYAENMTGSGRQRFGMELQMQGLREVDMDMLAGASHWVVGALLEAQATDTPECREIAAEFEKKLQIWVRMTRVMEESAEYLRKHGDDF